MRRGKTTILCSYHTRRLGPYAKEMYTMGNNIDDNDFDNDYLREEDPP
jgi:aromatic ring-cleaving dioxygenase